MTPSISVLCTFFNAEDTLRATLQSLRGQTVADAQFVLVDDGSADRSAVIADAFCDRDLRFVLHKNPVRGRGHALNLAIAKAGAEYVAILDADDLAHETWLEDALRLMRERMEFTVIGFERLSIRGDAQPQWEAAARPGSDPALQNVTRRLARANPLPHSGAVIRRSRILAVGGYDAGRQSLFDYDLWVRLGVAGDQLGRSGLVRIAKRYHQGQKFAHSRRYTLASLTVQCRAIVGVDRDYRSFVWLAWRAARELARHLKRALAPRTKGR